MNREEVEIRTIEKLIIQFDFYSSMSIDFGNETKNMFLFYSIYKLFLNNK